MKIGAVLLSLLALPAAGELRDVSIGRIEIEPQIEGLDAPWALGFLPGGDILITLRDGEMRRYDGTGQGYGAYQVVTGLPPVRARGQGGLLDVMVPRDFAETGEIFWTFARPQRGGAGTALARGILEGGALRDVAVIWELTPGSSGGAHFGSRVVEGPDGYLYVTIGDRGERPSAQDLRNENGSVVRLNRDGTVPAGNPFIDTPDARPGIWSYGHRNPQGMAVAPDGTLYVVEHGARGGDEVNRVAPGRNFGWPVIAYGRHYSGASIGIGTEAEGMEQPLHYWDPSIAPSGLAVYDGAMFPEWQGDLLVGALSFDLISRVDPDAGYAEVERIETPETARVRDVRVAPDGSIWFLSVGNGTAYRISR
ncbi:MAG: PQQ-dependent sugar dehydrogenase [Pseudomonadota bacterium]